jgi:hypothetical protein
MPGNDSSEIVEAKKQIQDLDLSMVANNMVIKQGWLKSEVEEACTLYRNFLFLNFKYPHKALAPSEDIDEFWHNHILDTRQYKIDCEKIFGRYLDHYPYFGIDGRTTMDNLNDSFARTQELHMKEFGYSITSVRYTKFCRLMRKILGEK